MQDSQTSPAKTSRPAAMAVAAMAAFSTYFCMYAFRKPFNAATFEDQAVFGFALKSALVIAQLVGYMLSKFIGIRVISAMRPERRAIVLIGLILFAEAALVGFAFLPTPLKVVMMFLNGLPLGMVFGLVLAYLEGRTMTEALTAALCASFIVASGVAKSAGQWLMQDLGIDEFQMPMIAGLLFLPPMLLSVWILQATPRPSATDREQRRERPAMDAAQRTRFIAAYWPGLTLVLFVYIALTVIRSVRDDYGVEIWRDLGEPSVPAVFAQMETRVAICVLAVSVLSIWIRGHLTAIRVSIAIMCLAFLLIATSVWLRTNPGSPLSLTPFDFMVAGGIGLYIPYVAFHTTFFERLIAASRHPCNLGFLMYLADAIGYLGYALVIGGRTVLLGAPVGLPFFEWLLGWGALASILALLAAAAFFERAIAREHSHAIMASPEPEALQ